MDGELAFENELIRHLETIGGSKQWRYEPSITTIPAMWANFRRILERNNADKLHGRPLTDGEFAQVKAVICGLRSPYEAGRWLYGMNGVTQVEIDRDETAGGGSGEHVFLTVFDQAQVGAGNTVYQIVNQIERPHVIAGRQNRRFDTTLLVNGLPIIHIEEKYDRHDALEGLHQIRQYIDEGLFHDIYSTVQILVGITPHQAMYMANTDAESFNTAFAFHWQREEDSKPVWDWREFAGLMPSIPMAHRMATSYMILDGDPKHKKLIVMRPYQVYATRRVIEKPRTHVFGTDKQEVGYVWHTTGFGKTISSFKTAWLASRLPNVDKVVFVVDEAHRSTNGAMLKRIKKAFPRSAWVGYTGTPAFDGDLTHQAFGDLLHAYTIREAIADRNVLGFNVDFENTLPNAEITGQLLPDLLRQRYPHWTEQR